MRRFILIEIIYGNWHIVQFAIKDHFYNLFNSSIVRRFYTHKYADIYVIDREHFITVKCKYNVEKDSVKKKPLY